MGGLNTIYLTSNWIFQNLMRRCCSTGKDIVFIYQGNRFAEDLIFDQKKKKKSVSLFGNESEKFATL